MNDPDPDLGIEAFVTHARDVHSAQRERFGDAAAELARDPRAILLRTCHRVELYVATASAAEARRHGGHLPVPELPSGGRRLEGDAVARHLFAVAAGLDSVVVGEDQVLHQLRETVIERHLASLDESGEAYSQGHRPELSEENSGELDTVLDRLFQLALHVGRQAHSWREGAPRSLADVALDRIEATGRLAGRTLLVVGAGQMSRLAALAGARRGASVVISNRTPGRAALLAAEVSGTTAEFGAVPADLAGVIVAISGPWPVTQGSLETIRDRGAVVVDLSSPPAFEDHAWAALGSSSVSVDDIARGPWDSLRPKLRRRVERLIDEASAEMARWVAYRAGVPTIQALTEQAETRRAEELERLLRRIPDLPEHERELVEQMSRRLVAGILHAPLASLRDDQSGEYERAARELFSL